MTSYKQYSFDQAKIYFDGFKNIHIVDLDGALKENLLIQICKRNT